jgi:hypothetical protein
MKDIFLENRMEAIRTILIVIRNILLGGNLISLSLLRHPRQFVSTISDILFYFKVLSGKSRLEQKNPDEILPSTKKYTLKVDTNRYFWGRDPFYLKDVVCLCILTHLVNAKRIFEIGTLLPVTPPSMSL